MPSHTYDNREYLKVATPNNIEMEMTRIDKPSKSRGVALQKMMLDRTWEVYQQRREELWEKYRIRSYNDFINFLIEKGLEKLVREL